MPNAPTTRRVHQLFEEQVGVSPDAIAVVAPDGTLSYRELDRRAERLAGLLESRGVGREVCAAICADRSLGGIVAVLAVHKAGGAYLPLDPEMPPRRARSMIDRARAGVLLFNGGHARRIDADVPAIDLEETAGESQGRERVRGSGGDLAYVIYTSGSTGIPKGVAMSHDAAVNLIAWQRRRFRARAGATTLQYASLSFDVAFQEIYSTLGSGGRLIVAGDSERVDFDALCRQMELHRVERAFLPPVALQHLAEAVVRGAPLPAHLAEVMAAGEQLKISPEIRELFARLDPEAVLHNQYGPTETHVATEHTLAGPSSDWPALPPIGAAIDGARVYVLDARMDPVPLGSEGEIYLGGVQVARGYLHQPERTAERFLPDPFRDDGGVMYRTGDLARGSAGGVVTYLGRADRQIKLRGHRIEPGEIETVLAAHRDVRAAVVIAVDTERSHRMLVAYAVAPERPSRRELRAHLQASLPDYMVPAAIVFIDELPLTVSGKVDRKELPPPNEEDLLRGGARSPLSTAAERELAAIWCEVLRLSEVFADDDFFALGGDSLLAARVLARMTGGSALQLADLFDHPVLSELASIAESRTAVDAPALVPIDRAFGEPVPASWAQEQLWFVDQLGGGGVHNVPLALRLEGGLAVDAVARALEEITRRHSGLRTSFTIVDGAPFQTISAPGPVPLSFEDLTALPRDRENAALARARTRALERFDLERGPLFRAHLLRIDLEDHLLVVTMHHIICDGWSLEVLHRELAELLRADRTGASPALPVLEIEPADHAAWERAALAPELDRRLSYWEEVLSEEPPRLELVVDRVRPTVRSYAGDWIERQLSRRLTEPLQELARSSGSTPFMTMLAAFCEILRRHSGQTDFVIGSVAAGRTHASLEPLIGDFVEMMPLRCDLRGRPSFRELIARVRGAVLAAQANLVPFHRLVDTLQPERTLGNRPFFDVLCVEDTIDELELDACGLSVRYQPLALPLSEFDLTMFPTRRRDALSIQLNYATELYERSTIERMAEQLEELLAAAVAEPDRPLSQVALEAPEPENTSRPYPHDRTVCSLFEEQARRRPDAIAVQSSAGSISYRVLNARANQLARRLRDLGVGAGEPVGIALPRSIELVTAFLAILKAGGAYLSLDLDQPAERLETMIADAKARIVITDSKSALRFTPRDATLLVLDRERARLDSLPAGDLDDVAHAQGPACVIFTSGSTGRPKGILVPHRGINRLVLETNYIRFRASDVVAQINNSTFDAITFEVWGALLSGGRLLLIPSDVLLAFDRLAALLREERVTVMVITTALFNQLVAEIPDALASLDTVCVGGEALDPESIRAALEHGPPRNLVNFYGPSESTTAAVTHPVRDVPAGARSIPIGRAIANTSAYVFDEEMRPLPAGIPGELYLGGDGLALGYVNRPDLTAERFVPHPRPRFPGERLYRTGDRVRLLPSGDIDFLGRTDHQIKLRGYRIELSEIEACVRVHGASEAAVVLREDSPGDRRIVAYYSGASDEGALARHLERLLPSYMLPSAIVRLPRLPLTPNGKVDTRALPRPERPSREGGRPSTTEECLIADVWRELLGVEEVSLDDDFFGLGGDSLLAAKLALRLGRQLGRTVPVSIVFERRTLRELAGALASGSSIDRGPVIRKDAGRASAPLTSGQERLWALALLAGDGAAQAYNIPCAIHLAGRIDVEALADCFDLLVDRHQILRAVFDRDDLVQRILPLERRVLEIADLRGLSDEARRAQLEAIRERERTRVFDLVEGPLFAASLALLSDTEQITFITHHHLISDGWSLRVMLQELNALYLARVTRRAPVLPELPVQFTDYAEWERARASDPARESGLAHWRRVLEGAPAELDLPADYARPPRPSGRGDQLVHSIAGLGPALKALAAEHATTDFTVLLAALELLLHRLSGQEELLIGTVVANRSVPEVEGLVGFFANTLPLRGDLRGDPTFHELVDRVKEAALAAWAHGDVPFSDIVELSGASRSGASRPLIQVIATLEELDGAESELFGVEARTEFLHTRTAKFDLSFFMRVGPQDLFMGVEYDLDLFERSTVERMVRQLEQTLRRALQEPTRPVSALTILGEDEERRILSEWNDTARPYLRDRTVCSLFEEQAQRTPDAAAVQEGARSLTYRELDARANRLARFLRSEGVAPGTPVAVALARSIELVVAFLGVLKAGGAYLVLDPEHPPARLSGMIEEAGAGAVLTDEASRARFGSCETRMILLDRERDRIASFSTDALDIPANAGSAACIIFTSGSTGHPKGIMIPHRGIARLVLDTDYIRFRSSDVVAQVSNGAFDAITFEVWGALLSGAKLLVIPTDVLLAFDRLAELLRRERVSVILLTTALFNQLIAELPDALASLDTVCVGGEALSPASVRAALEHGPPERLLNLYGPAESTTVATWYRIREVHAGARSIPIGRPIANTTAYVFDRRMRPAPIGVPGELYLGGDGLALGYVNRPDLTAERFVPHPFPRFPGERLYRTGDRARLLPSGDLDFLGRTDHQIKLRGFRIELSEIEAGVRAGEGVREAAVVLREDAPGDRRIVAYYSGTSDEGSLARHLERRLPSYMLPSALVRLSRLPLTPGGKVATGELPRPERSARTGARASTTLERIVAELFCELLGVEEVSRDDDFFLLGGNSILAARLALRLGRAVERTVPMHILFERRTVAGLARELAEASTRDRAQTIGRASDRDSAPLTSGQERLWALALLTADAAQQTYSIPCAIHLTGSIEVDALMECFETLVERHQILRTVFDRSRPIQRVARSAPALEIVDLRALSDEARAERLSAMKERERTRVLDLFEGPLLSATLALLSKTEQILFITQHHLISDGWSIHVMQRELSALYRARVQGVVPELPELPLQFADYATWERERSFEAGRAYWRRALEGAPAELDLPTDFVRPPRPSGRGGYLVHSIPGVAVALRSTAAEHASTDFVVLLAALELLLHRLSGREDLLVGTVIANRSTPEVEELIGFFANTLPLRADLRGDPSFGGLVERVRETALAAWAHGDVPFSEIVEVAELSGAPAHRPLIQVLFSLEELDGSELDLPGVETRTELLHTGTAKFDLGFFARVGTEDLSIALEYDRDLFDEGSAERMLRQLERALLQGLEDPSRPISKIAILTEEERRRVLVDWNDTARPYPRDRTVTSLFEEHARRTPHAVAVQEGERSLTYRQLDARANGVARLLQSEGVAPGMAVAVALERSIELVVAFAGVLKAGGAYLALDPEHPPARLTAMIEDAGAEVLLTDSSLVDRFASSTARAILLDRAEDRIASSTAALEVAVSAGSAAYITFTSGSTGRPKGIMIPHRGITRLVLETDYIRFRASDVVAQISNSAFDAITFEVWGALLSGAKLLVIPSDVLLTFDRLTDQLRKERVSAMLVTTAVFNQLIAEIPDALRSVDTVCVGGEALSPESVRAALEHGPPRNLVNFYGPSESTTGAVTHSIRAVPAGARSIPIGRPIANTTAYVLDAAMGPVPIGVPGELYLGGDGLALGYVNRPDLTAERFVPHPFAREPGERLYRTGDRVRLLQSGDIDFLGRTDHQIKLRGFRIELFEIEAVMKEHPGVREVLVTTRPSVRGELQIVGYYTSAPEHSEAELERHLEAQLPRYMIPSALIRLERMPLSPNGKIDRAALPAPIREKRGGLEPRTEVERRIARIWSEELGVPSVGATDDFFDLGGHSLLAIRVLSRVREELGPVPPSRFFERPTVEAIAEALSRKDHGPGEDALLEVLGQLSDAEVVRLLERIHAG